jgi:hypothetical protein
MIDYQKKKNAIKYERNGSHNPTDIEDNCSRVLVLQETRLWQSASPHPGAGQRKLSTIMFVDKKKTAETYNTQPKD